jgi:hypothetical protein
MHSVYRYYAIISIHQRIINNIEVINSLSSFYCKHFEKITILKKDKITINFQLTPVLK